MLLSRKLNKLIICVDKIVCQKFISNIISENTFLLSWKQCRSRSASFFRSWLIRIYTVIQAVYALLQNLEISWCESDLYPHAKNSKRWLFQLAFLEKLLAFSKYASAKFNPWLTERIKSNQQIPLFCFSFFLYVFLAALVVLCLVGAQQLLSQFGVSYSFILHSAR